MSFILVFVQLDEAAGVWTARSPSLPRIKATGKTADEAEQNYMLAVEVVMDDWDRRQREARAEALFVQEQREVVVRCVSKTKTGTQCQRETVSETLCAQHWGKLYGHEPKWHRKGKRNIEMCRLCGYVVRGNEQGAAMQCPQKEPSGHGDLFEFD